MGITYTLYNREHKEYLDLGKLIDTGDRLRFHEEATLVDYFQYKFRFNDSISIEVISDSVDDFDNESYTDLDDVFIPKATSKDLKLIVNSPNFDAVQVNNVDELISIISEYISSNSFLPISLTRQQAKG